MITTMAWLATLVGAYGALVPPLKRMPQVHFTPPCYRAVAPPHDIAAALWDPAASTYTVMPGCWHVEKTGPRP